MEKLYLDRTEIPDNIALIVGNGEIIETGTTVYSMSVRDNNELYRKFADKYDIHFVFENAIPAVDFYAVPRADIIAVDSCGGYFASVGGSFDRERPVCYIDGERNCYLVSENVQGFVEDAPNWRAMLTPWEGLEIFPSKADAKEKYTLFGKADLEALQAKAVGQGLDPAVPY